LGAEDLRAKTMRIYRAQEQAPSALLRGSSVLIDDDTCLAFFGDVVVRRAVARHSWMLLI
jgi:hypothetical protein